MNDLDQLLKDIQSWIHMVSQGACTEDEAMQKITHLIQILYCKILAR